MASVTQPVPGQEALLVELPGRVQDPDRAVARLGGLHAVAGVAAGQAQFLNFHFRPGDPLAHPLQGDRRAARGLLLRVSRKAATGAGAACCHLPLCCCMPCYWAIATQHMCRHARCMRPVCMCSDLLGLDTAKHAATWALDYVGLMGGTVRLAMLSPKIGLT